MEVNTHEDMEDLDKLLGELGTEARLKAEQGVISDGEAVIVNLLCGVGSMLLRIGEKIDLTNDLLADMLEQGEEY